jgi:hypothetical protein
VKTNPFLSRFIGLALLASPLILSAQKVIDYPPKIVIICKDGADRKCLGGVKVVFGRGDSLAKTCTTDGTGRCLLLNPKPGNYYIAASKPGYLQFILAKVEIPGDQTVILDIPLEPDPNSKQNKKTGRLVADAADLIPYSNY